MSRIVYSYGLMALVANPDPLMNCQNHSDDAENAREDFACELDDDNSKLRLSNDGTVVFIDLNMGSDDDLAHLRLQIGDETPVPIDVAALYNEAKKYNIELIHNTQRVFQCTWWNGSDSPMKRLTADSYTKRLSFGGNHA